MGYLDITGSEKEDFRFVLCKWPEENGTSSRPESPISFCARASLYRLMKRRALSEHDQPMASKWHYLEKEMQKRENKPSSLVLFFYWLLCGYGERPLRALGWLILFLVLPLLMFSVSEGLRYIPFTKLPRLSDNYTGVQLLGMSISQLVITIQATLFGFALRNKFRR